MCDSGRGLRSIDLFTAPKVPLVFAVRRMGRVLSERANHISLKGKRSSVEAYALRDQCGTMSLPVIRTANYKVPESLQEVCMSEFDCNVRRNTASSRPSSEAIMKKVTVASPANVSVLDARLRKLLALIADDPLGNSQEWALRLNLSNSHLQHLFKEATGVALGRVLTEKRLQKAAQLLATTNLSIKEVACAAGYEHASSFTRAFERRFAQTPRHFRIKNAA